MKYKRMQIEQESPEQLGYDLIKYNLSESSVADRHLADLKADLDDVLLCYGDHMGNPELRREIASLGAGIAANDVMVTAGAASALFIIATSLLTANDHLVVVRPNYATNIETPRAIGCDISYIDVTFEDGFHLDIAALESAIKPNTKFVSITYPHNPSGVMLSEGELRAIVEMIDRKGCKLLFDETYREMTQGTPLPVAATLSDNVFSVSSLSKTYGIPGIRIGWLICRDPELMTLFLSAKEQIGISGSMVDEAIGHAALVQRDEWLAFNNARIKTAFDLVKSWVENEEYIEWVEPKGGCVCFPRIKPNSDIDLAKFYSVLFEKYGTYVGPGHWFEMPDNYFRLGYAWPTLDELEHGLAGLSGAIRDSLK